MPIISNNTTNPMQEAFDLYFGDRGWYLERNYNPSGHIEYVDKSRNANLDWLASRLSDDGRGACERIGRDSKY